MVGIKFKTNSRRECGAILLLIGCIELASCLSYTRLDLSADRMQSIHTVVFYPSTSGTKDSYTDFLIKWSIVTPPSSYRGNSSHCNLCLAKKLRNLSADRSDESDDRFVHETQVTVILEFLSSIHISLCMYLY